MKAKKLISRILVFAMVLCMMVAVATPVAAAEANQAVTDAKSAVVQIQLWYVDHETAQEEYLQSGTGFLINENTVLTNQHVVTAFPDSFYVQWAQETNKALGLKRSAEDIRNNIEIRISVLRDVYIKATIRKASTEMDYAILTMEEKLYDRTTLPLRSSATLKQTESVFALGFPSAVSGLQDQDYYDADDVTITTGNVNKVDRSDFNVVGYDALGSLAVSPYHNVDVVSHSAAISAGNSGGPLVDANGNAVAINAAGDDMNMNIAISLDPIMQIMDALGIEYDKANETPAPVATEAPAPVATEAPVPVATEAPASVATEAPAHVATEAPVKETVAVETPVTPAGNMTIILIVVVVAVVAVIVVVVVVLSGKNKKKAAPAPAAYAHAGAPAANNGGFNTTPPAPVYTAPMDAGETSVLSQSAGETTVLNRHVNGGTLIRKRTGETVNINAENFVIGRERKTSNYCITDNNSISRGHVTLNVRGGVTYLIDMNAANGTFVNGVKVMPRQEIALKSGDKITLADEDFEFRG